MTFAPDRFVIGITSFIVAKPCHLNCGGIDHTGLPDIDPTLSLSDAIASYQAYYLLLAADLLSSIHEAKKVYINPDLRSAILYLRQIERESALQ